MLAFSYYLLKVTICSTVLYGYYWCLLRNKIFHSYNRFYLLATIILSLGLPLLEFNLWQQEAAPKTAVIQMLQVVNNSDKYMDEIIVQGSSDHISKATIAGWLFSAICLVAFLILLYTIYKIWVLKKQHECQVYEGIQLIRTNDKRTPFSFFKNIFWNDSIDINGSTGRRILKHELAHVQEKHSHDKLLINVVLTVFWCNPVYWLIRKELNMIHEFIADRKAVEDGDTSAFAAMILQASYPGHRFELTNNFFYSPIKRRLSMLTKNNKMKVTYISRLLVLPLAAIVFAAFSLKAKTFVNKLTENKIITVVIDAGHGGTDNGGIAIDGSYEKDLTLALVKKIKELNRNENLRIILTRETDIYQQPKEKAALAKKSGADIFISIHINSEPFKKTPPGSGMEVLVSKTENSNSEKSKLLATAVINAFGNNYKLAVSKSPIQKEQSIWVLQEATCPAVLIEAGFLSNQNDLNYLKSVDGMEQFATNVLNAIAAFEADPQTEIENLTAVKDTSPINKNLKQDSKVMKFTNATVLTNFEGTFQIDANDQDLNSVATSDFKNTPLIIINGKEWKISDFNNKKITAVKAFLYPENDAQMLSEYGTKAKQGVLILERANVEELPAADKKPAITDFKLSENLDSTYAIDARQDVIISGQNYTAIRKMQQLNMMDENSPLVYLNGELSRQDIFKSLSPDRIQRITILKNENATKKYGDKANKGVIEVFLKTDPTVSLSGISNSRIDITRLKEITELVCYDPEFKVVSATVYFSGPGFPQVISSTINSSSLQPLEKYFAKIISGTNVTFDNIQVSKKDGSGLMTIAGKGFSFF